MQNRFESGDENVSPLSRNTLASLLSNSQGRAMSTEANSQMPSRNEATNLDIQYYSQKIANVKKNPLKSFKLNSHIKLEPLE